MTDRQTYDHAWNEGFKSGIHFACFLLHMPKEKVEEITAEFVRRKAEPLVPKKQTNRVRRK